MQNIKFLRVPSIWNLGVCHQILINFLKKIDLWMQPSMGTLNAPSSRVIKDLMPSRRRIFKYIHFGTGESWPFLSKDKVNLHLTICMVNLKLTCVLLFYYFLYLKVNLDMEKKQISLVNLNQLYFAVVNLDPIILEKRWIDGESWPNDFVEKVNRGEDEVGRLKMPFDAW